MAIAISIIILGILLLFFWQNGNKNLENGNTNTIQTDEDLERYIENISSYRAQMTVSIQSNKTTNKYKVTQEYNKSGIQKMIIQEPENKKGLEIENREGTITVRNTKLGLNEFYEQEEQITSNRLWLPSFIEDYKKDNTRSMKKTDEEIILEATLQDKHPYYCYTQLYINAKTKKPTQLIVQDKDRNNRIYILYNEIEINS